MNTVELGPTAKYGDHLFHGDEKISYGIKRGEEKAVIGKTTGLSYFSWALHGWWYYR